MTIVRDEHSSNEALAIVEKYEAVVNYLYKILRNCPRQHGIARDEMLKGLFAPVPALYAAGKSQQVSRLYAIDADLASIRFWLRFMVHPDRKVITPHQQKVALTHLAEIGRMLGGWIKTLKSKG